MTNPQAVLTLTGLAITLAALVLAVIWKLDAKNEKAHASIGENIRAVDARAEQRAVRLEAAIKGVEGTVASIACDVSFLAGRQAERDRTAPPPPAAPDPNPDPRH